MNRVILKYTTNFNPILKHLTRYVSLYNHIYLDHIHGDTFFEVVTDGMIAFYKDIDAFKALISPKVKIYSPENRLPSGFIKTIFDPAEFPPEGIHVYMEVYNPPTEQIFPLVVEYFNRIVPKVRVNQINKQVQVIFQTFEQMDLYLSYLFSTFPRH